MMHEVSRLESLLVSELLAIIDEVEVGSEFPVPSSADLCSSMELYLPRLLREFYPEWESESIDGFFVARAARTGPLGAALVGTCILIRDQRMTPFAFDVEVAPSRDRLAACRVRIGEPGGGPLGISGPRCSSTGASRLLHGLPARLDDVPWVYTVHTGPFDGGPT